MSLLEKWRDKKIINICSHSTTILSSITKASSKFMHLNG